MRKKSKKKTYDINFWEKKSVWVYHTVRLKTSKKPTKDNLKELLETRVTDYLDSDFNLETAENLEYDFENDLEIEEVKG